MLIRSIAIAASLACANAHAVFIDFEGIAEGTAPGAYYAAQGVTFDGGIVRYNALGAYLTGPVVMRVDPAIVGKGISLLADARDDDTPSLVCGSFCESMHIPTTRVPNGVPAGHVTWDVGTLFSSVVKDEYDGITSIVFNTTGLDNIWFDNIQRQPSRILRAGGAGDSIIKTGEVPLPGTMWLLGAGMLALASRRKWV